jgi:hypothetical protein
MWIQVYPWMVSAMEIFWLYISWQMCRKAKKVNVDDIKITICINFIFDSYLQEFESNHKISR